MTKEEVDKFAVDCGYKKAIYSSEWKGYEVYTPVRCDIGKSKIIMTGYPLVIMVKGDDIRMSTNKESLAYLRHCQIQQEKITLTRGKKC